jgi:hypothetical protein
MAELLAEFSKFALILVVPGGYGFQSIVEGTA